MRSFGGPTMGSYYEIKFVGGAALEDVRTAVEAELAAFDLAFSNWREDSEIARCNRHASTAPFPASERFLGVLQQALDVAAATDGAFDPTVAPLSDLYRRQKRDPGARIDAAEVAAARARVGWGQVAVERGAVVKRAPDVQLDLDGIVAGAACDAIADRLRALGVGAFFLQVTGEILAGGEKAPGVPWIVGVVDPRGDLVGEELPLVSLPLRDRSLCTSGDYRNAIDVAGERRHHIFDPRTGASTDNGVVSASVLAPSAAVADALGTAFLVLGADGTRARMPELARRFGSGPGTIAALLLLPDGQGGWRQEAVDWPQ